MQIANVNQKDFFFLQKCSLTILIKIKAKLELLIQNMRRSCSHSWRVTWFSMKCHVVGFTEQAMWSLGGKSQLEKLPLRCLWLPSGQRVASKALKQWWPITEH